MRSRYVHYKYNNRALYNDRDDITMSLLMYTEHGLMVVWVVLGRNNKRFFQKFSGAILAIGRGGCETTL